MEIATVPAPASGVPRERMVEVASSFAEVMAKRRSVRDFSTEPVPAEVIEAAIRAAATAPSGANLQPWRFVVVTEPERKRRLRVAAEEEEREFYDRRASPEWLEALAPSARIGASRSLRMLRR